MSSTRTDPPTADAATAPVDPPAPGAPAAPPAYDAERAELQRQGAKAAVRGEARESNPMLDADARDLTRLATLSILLYRDGVATWHQARDGGGDVDVAAIELDRGEMPAGSALRPFGPQHLAAGFDAFDVGSRLAIPGFPLGFFDTLHHLPVVRQASIASHYGVRFQGLGFFLTDARMHRGSSGSPVLAPVQAHGNDQPRWCLLGIHSSRMDMAPRDAVQDESLGLNGAWYADVLMPLTASADAR